MNIVHNVLFFMANTPLLDFLSFSTTRLLIDVATVFSYMAVLHTSFLP